MIPKKILSCAFAVLISLSVYGSEYKFNFVYIVTQIMLSGQQSIKGYGCCKQVDADCQMLTLTGDGDQQEQLQNFESSIAQRLMV